MSNTCMYTVYNRMENVFTAKTLAVKDWGIIKTEVEETDRGQVRDRGEPLKVIMWVDVVRSYISLGK